ncbi:hypothetical protein E2562_000858 [Oryza meyeriana var. granulata]|uniref:Uncharacterized protein n=1 Tax=Oryza meyeriana var. granulata TaxID=110450 RepID=A0A6G1CX40_9ORYZ|nr:hypothetical protein E2562_000858 [Oryza meyeriana var. granulata]
MDGDDDFGQAALLFTDAIRAGPPSAALFAERAQAFIENGNFAEAAADARRAADLDPTMPRAHLRKAHACMKLQRYDSAKAAVEAGAALVSGDARFAHLMEELDEKSRRMSPTEAAATDAQKGGEVKNDEEEKLAAGAAASKFSQDICGNNS